MAFANSTEVYTVCHSIKDFVKKLHKTEDIPCFGLSVVMYIVWHKPLFWSGSEMFAYTILLETLVFKILSHDSAVIQWRNVMS